MKVITGLILFAIAACAAAKHLSAPEDEAVVIDNKMEIVKELDEVDEAEEDKLPPLRPNGCPWSPRIPWLIPNRLNCSRFYQCVRGHRVAMSCPASLHFNEDLQVCDWPWAAGCHTETWQASIPVA